MKARTSTTIGIMILLIKDRRDGDFGLLLTELERGRTRARNFGRRCSLSAGDVGGDADRHDFGNCQLAIGCRGIFGERERVRKVGCG